MRAQSILVGAVSTAALILACNVDLVLRTKTPSAKEPSPNCKHTLIPTRPDTAKGGGADLPSSYVSVKSFGAGSLASPIGVDLDGLCSCFGDPASCTARGTLKLCDANDAGVDNSTGALFDAVKTLFPLFDRLNEMFQDGDTRGIVLRVEGYNGGTDDPAVTLAFYESTGVETTPPTWTASDRWKVDVAAAAGDAPTNGKPESRVPRLSSTSAYVRDGVLVAPLGDNALLRLDPRLELKLQRATFTARIRKLTDTSLELTGGLLTGTWVGEDILRAIRNADAPGSSTNAICDIPIVEEQARLKICEGLDLLKDENAGAESLCDAASLGLAMELAPASLGANSPTNVIAPRCMEKVLKCD